MLRWIDAGPFLISTYRLFMLSGLAVGGALLRRELWRLEPGRRWLWLPLVLVAGVAGVFGARLLGTLHDGDWAGLLARPLRVGAGGSWFGGLLLATAAAALAWRLSPSRQPFLAVCDLAAPAAALGLAILRIGCFVAGDGCYGRPTGLPWGVRYPDGAPPTAVAVHPTELYEAAAMAGLFVWLWRRRRRTAPAGRATALYLVAAAAERFVIELWRRNPAALGGLTEAQLFALLLAAAGAVLLIRSRREAISHSAAPRPSRRPVRPSSRLEVWP